MAIEVVCDDCGNKYRVSDDKAGSRVKCRECGSRIDVPDGDDDGFDTEVASRPSSRKRKKSAGGQSAGIMIGVGAVGLVLVLGIVLFMMGGRGNGGQVAQGNPAPLPVTPAPMGPPPAPMNNPGNTTASNAANNSVPGSGLPSTPAAQPAAALPNTALPNTAVANNRPGAGLPSSAPAAVDPPANPPAEAPAKSGLLGAGNQNAQPPGKKFGGFAGGDAGAPDAPLPDHWNVKVDPAPAEAKIDGSKPINLRFPKGANNTDILFPASPSNFVALGANSGFCPTREIWNLATKAKVGTVNGSVGGWPMSALSPDGQHLAISQAGGKDEGVSVWICKTGKSLGELSSGSRISNLMFASATQLVGFCQDGTAKVWKLPSGDQEFDLTIDNGKEPQSAAPSPGGNYLAVVTDKTALKMFDLKTGEVAGELPLPFGDVFFAGKPEALSFSPDGVELAMVMPSGVHEKDFLIYNVADGKLLTKVAINVKDIWGGGPDRVTGNRLEWFPDRSKLLWRGHHVLDAKIGGPVWSAPTEDGSSDAPRKLIGADRILIVVGGRQNPSLKTAPVPVSEISASAKLVAEGGEASDAGLPPLTKADTSGVSPVALGSGTAWSMKPDGSPAGPKVKNTVAIPKERASLGGTFISRPHMARAVVWSSDGANNLTSAKPMIRPGVVPSRGAGTVDIDVFNLVSGKLQGTVPLAYPCAVLDVGPDGDCVAVRTTKPNEERIDVYELPSGKPVAAWRPHLDQHSAMRGVKNAVLLDTEYCITQAPIAGTFDSGTTTMWKLPECKAVWRVEKASSFTISPGGKYVGFSSNSRYYFVEARTGTVVGELALQFPRVRCAFHPTGTHVAVLNADEISHHIAIIDVATGKPTAEFYVPHGSDWIEWCGDTNLLLDDQWLVDLKQQKYAWQYELKYGAHALRQADGRHWFLSSTGLGDHNITLSGAAIPEPTVQAKIDAAQLPDESLLKPGMQFGLQVNLQATSPAHPNLANQIGDNFKAGLQRNGFSVVPTSPYAFIISTTQANPAEPAMKFGNGGPFDPRVEVPIMHVTCEVALVHNGQAIWKNTKLISNRSYMVFLPEGEQIGTFLTKQVWNAAADHLTKFPVPKQVFGFNATAGLGQSQFVPGGTQPVNR